MQESSLSRKSPGVWFWKETTTSILILSLILLAGISVRLYHFTSPILDMHHWRQTETEAVAYNFYHHGFNLFYPQVRWFGEQPNYVCSELQIYPFMVAGLWKITGVHAWGGRIVSIAFFVFSSILLFLITRKYFDRWVAVSAVTFFSILPLNVFFTRTFQPESVLIFLQLASVYSLLLWLDTNKWSQFILFMTTFVLALLVKATSLPLGILLFVLVAEKRGIALFRDWRLWMCGGLSILIPGIWYHHAHQLGITYGQSWVDVWATLFNLPGGETHDTFSIIAEPTFLQVFFVQRLFNEIFARLGGVVFFLVGVVTIANEGRNRWLHLWFLIIFGSMILFAGRITGHQYYVLPLTPVVAIFMGKGACDAFRSLRSLSHRGLRIILLIIVTLLLTTIPWNSRSVIKGWYELSPEILPVGPLAQKLIPDGDLIVASCGGGPSLLNWCNRDGWYIGNLKEVTPEILTDLHLNGHAAWFVCSHRNYLREETLQFLSRHRILFQSENGIIVKFVSPADLPSRE